MSRSKQLHSKFVDSLNQTADTEIQTAKDGPSLAVIGCGYWGCETHPGRPRYTRS
jgi:hypothetical protein